MGVAGRERGAQPRVLADWGRWPVRLAGSLQPPLRSPAVRRVVAAAGPRRSLLALAAGLAAAQAQLTLGTDAGPAAVLDLAARAALGTWLALTVLRIATAVTLGSGADDVGDGAAGGVGPWRVLLAGAVLIGAALQRAPDRLALNLLGYGLVALPVLWLVHRRAGHRYAAEAAAALVLFTFMPTRVDVPRATVPAPASSGSAFHWTAGWPVGDWALRHELQLDAADGRPRVLVVPLAVRYTGPARVLATLNGRDLGPARLEEGTALKIDVPPDLLRDHAHLALELRQRPFDPALRITAHRWDLGASAGPGASSFFDGRQWWPGTFDDVAGRRLAGIYQVRVEAAEP